MTHSDFQLPAVKQPVSLDTIKAICDHYGLPALWKKIENNPPRLVHQPVYNVGVSWSVSIRG